MGHTSQTTNLHLPQFIGSDKPTWLSDMNGAFAAIDTAYGTIESDSAAAVTAAGNAVTTANAANTTASNASTAATSASNQASQALTAANNAAYTANQADTKAGNALNISEGLLLAEVEADGVKTAGALLDELFAAADTSKITEKAVLEYFGVKYHIAFSTPSLKFTYVNAGPSALTISSISLVASGSAVYDGSITTGSTTITTNTSYVGTSGLKIKLYA